MKERRELITTERTTSIAIGRKITPNRESLQDRARSFQTSGARWLWVKKGSKEKVGTIFFPEGTENLPKILREVKAKPCRRKLMGKTAKGKRVTF